MSSTFSLAPKPYIRESNGNLLPPKSMLTTIRAEVITAPKQRNTRIFPELSIQGIPVADLHVQEIVQRQSKSIAKVGTSRKSQFDSSFLEEAYQRCRNICAEYAKTFYLGPISFPSLLCLFLFPSNFLISLL